MKFLTLEKEAFGLDISDRSLKIIKLKKNKKSFKLASFNQINIKPGIIEKGVIQDEDALVKIIKSACQNVKGTKLNTKYVVASLPEERSFLQVIQMPKMEEGELKLTVPFQAENYIPLPISEVYLDFQTIPPIKDHLNHLDVLIVAMPKKIINAYVSCLKKANLIPLVFEVESEAIARALIKDETSSAPVVLIDLGKNSTDFIVFAGRSIQFTCSIPVSSESLTNAICEALGVGLEKAEKLKMKYDVNIIKTDNTSKKITKAVTPILEELVLQIKKYLKFYKDHASHEHLDSIEPITEIFLCGGGAKLKGLPRFLSAKLDLTVKLKDFWVEFSSAQLEDGEHKSFLSFATALGLALRDVNSNS